MKTCLIVDDSGVIRMVAKRIIQELGFETAEAADGQIALEMSQESLPDAVLLDWNMPNMDGLEYLRALRQLPGGDTVRVIFCTTENDLRHIQEALAAGADEYIMKPFDKEIVANKFDLLGLLE